MSVLSPAEIRMLPTYRTEEDNYETRETEVDGIGSVNASFKINTKIENDFSLFIINKFQTKTLKIPKLDLVPVLSKVAAKNKTMPKVILPKKSKLKIQK